MIRGGRFIHGGGVVVCVFAWSPLSTLIRFLRRVRDPRCSCVCLEFFIHGGGVVLSTVVGLIDRPCTAKLAGRYYRATDLFGWLGGVNRWREIGPELAHLL